MIRDTFFSPSRFMNLCRKEILDNWRVNLLRFVMMYTIMAIAFLWTGYFEYSGRFDSHAYMETDPMWSVIFFISLAVLIITGMLSASFLMERMKTKTNRIAVLMTPATMFEKFFSRWLIFTFGFLLAFIVSFKLADWTRVLVYMLQYPGTDVICPMPLSYIHSREVFPDGGTFILYAAIYFFAQSVFVLGSSIWAGNSFIKTLAAVLVIALIYMSGGAVCARIFFPEHGTYGVNQQLSDETLTLLVTLFFWLMASFNWVLAYFRFKESEIINRW